MDKGFESISTLAYQESVALITENWDFLWSAKQIEQRGFIRKHKLHPEAVLLDMPDSIDHVGVM